MLVDLVEERGEHLVIEGLLTWRLVWSRLDRRGEALVLVHLFILCIALTGRELLVERLDTRIGLRILAAVVLAEIRTLSWGREQECGVQGQNHLLSIMSVPTLLICFGVPAKARKSSCIWNYSV